MMDFLSNMAQIFHVEAADLFLLKKIKQDTKDIRMHQKVQHITLK